MNVNRREIKQKADQALKGKILKLGVVASWIEYVLTTQLALPIFMFVGGPIILNLMIPDFLNLTDMMNTHGPENISYGIIVMILYKFSMVFLFIWEIVNRTFFLGTASMYLEVIKGENKAYIQNLLFCFSNMKAAIRLGIRMSIIIDLWSILLLIPGIIKRYEYSMSYFIMAENPTLTAKKAMKTSSLIMKGNKWELFKLDLSFIGWFLLIIPSSGLILIWILPYRLAARAVFYEKIKNRENEIKNEDTLNLFNECSIS